MSHKRIHNSFKTFRNVKTFTINNNDFPDLSIQKNVELQNEQNMNYKEVAQWKEPSKLENNGEFNLKPGWLKIYYKDGKIQKEWYFYDVMPDVSAYSRYIQIVHHPE